MTTTMSSLGRYPGGHTSRDNDEPPLDGRSIHVPVDEPPLSDIHKNIDASVRTHLDPQAYQSGDKWTARIEDREVFVWKIPGYSGKVVKVDFNFDQKTVGKADAVNPGGSPAMKSMRFNTPRFLEKLSVFCQDLKARGFIIKVDASDERRARIYQGGLERMGLRQVSGRPNMYEWRNYTPRGPE